MPFLVTSKVAHHLHPQLGACFISVQYNLYWKPRQSKLIFQFYKCFCSTNNSVLRNHKRSKGIKESRLYDSKLVVVFKADVSFLRYYWSSQLAIFNNNLKGKLPLPSNYSIINLLWWSFLERTLVGQTEGNLSALIKPNASTRLTVKNTFNNKSLLLSCTYFASSLFKRRILFLKR